MSAPAPLRYGLVGWPLEFSLSPLLHAAAFEAAGLDATYELVRTPPGSLNDPLRSLREGTFAGLNITIPFKVEVTALLDDVAESARLVGAVNTVQRVSDVNGGVADTAGAARVADAADAIPVHAAAPASGARLVGHNTDVAGFRLQWKELGVPAGPVAVLGAGGAARAAVAELVGEGRVVTVIARRPEAGARLVADLPGAALTMRVLPWTEDSFRSVLGETTPSGPPSSSRDPGTPRAVALVNATPEPAPVPPGLALPHFVADLLAWPVPTALETRARAAGGTASGGLTMLVGQAADAFALWTGLEPPVEVMRAAAARAVAA